MKLTELVLDHIEITKQTKQEACRHNEGPSDLTPMVIWVNSKDETNLAIVDVQGRTVEYMPKTLSMVALQDPKVVIWISESLSMAIGNEKSFDEFKETHKSGDLAALYAERGPLSGVEEIIAFNALDTDTGEQVQGLTRFHYDDSGMPVFGETSVFVVEEKYVDEANVTMIFKQFYQFMVEIRANKN